MPADIWVNISGSNKQYLKGYVNIDGVWRNIEKIWVNISGTWKEVGFQYILDYVGTGSDITNASAYAASGVVGNYAVIAGGYGNTSSNPSHNIVTAYTENLIKTTPTALATARQGAFSGSNPSYLLIGGGFNNNGGYTNQLSTVETYNTSLARGTASSLSQARGNGAR